MLNIYLFIYILIIIINESFQEGELYHSDSFLIYKGPSKFIRNSTKPLLSLYSRFDLEKTDIVLCEFKGPILNTVDINLISEEQIDGFHIESKYMLLGNNICFEINDCRKDSSRDCYNVKVLTIGNKRFLQSKRPLKQDEELFLDFGKEYWNNVENSTINTGHASRLSESEIPSNIISLHSEELMLDIRNYSTITLPSTVDFTVGKGVFAKYDMPKGTLLCEYFGQLYYVNSSVSCSFTSLF
jgi:hypothetical protein